MTKPEITEADRLAADAFFSGLQLGHEGVRRLEKIIARHRQQAVAEALAARNAEIERLREARDLAYGLLWSIQPIDRRDYKDDRACRAREALLATMTREDQAKGIEAARAALQETK